MNGGTAFNHEILWGENFFFAFFTLPYVHVWNFTNSFLFYVMPDNVFERYVEFVWAEKVSLGA